MDTVTGTGDHKATQHRGSIGGRAEHERKARRKGLMLLSDEELAKLDSPTRRTLLHYEALEEELIRANEYAYQLYWITRHESEGGKPERWCWLLVSLVACLGCPPCERSTAVAESTLPEKSVRLSSGLQDQPLELARQNRARASSSSAATILAVCDRNQARKSSPSRCRPPWLSGTRTSRS